MNTQSVEAILAQASRAGQFTERAEWERFRGAVYDGNEYIARSFRYAKAAVKWAIEFAQKRHGYAVVVSRSGKVIFNGRFEGKENQRST